MSLFRRLLQGLADLVWPPQLTCLGCESPLDGGGGALRVCDRCWGSLFFPDDLNRCHGCARPVAVGSLCIECEAGLPFGRVWALGLHRGPLRQLIHQLKFNDRPGLGAPLGRLLGQQVGAGYDLIVPVPLHPARMRERGYNQAALVAQGLADRIAIPVVEHGLVRLRATDAQSRLGRGDRLRNLQGAFAPLPELHWQGRSVLLVDDVLTTGATAAMAANALLQAGAVAIDLAVLAVSDKVVSAALAAW